MADKKSEKKHKIMSLAIDGEMQDLLKISAKKSGVSVSQLIRKLVENHLDLLVNDGTDIPVIIRIPVHMKGDYDSLKHYMDAKSDAIAKFLST